MDGEEEACNDDASSRSTCETFSSDEESYSDEDHERFVEMDGSPGVNFRRVESNDPDLQKMTVNADYPSPSLDVWLAMGQNIGRNTHLKTIHISFDNCSEGDENASPRIMETFFSGLADNRSLRRLSLEDVPPLAGALRPFLIENRNLVDLRWNLCNLGVRHIREIADAFRQRQNAEPVKTIGITGADFDREMARAVVPLADACPKLKKLLLGPLHPDLLAELVPLLRNPNSVLKCLRLTILRGADEDERERGIQALATALSTNNVLQRLSVSTNFGLVTAGWGNFFRVVCDTSSINATYESNHSLERLWQYNHHEEKLPGDLLFALRANKGASKASASRKKIFRYHLCGNFDMSPLRDMDSELLPTALGWVGRDFYHATIVEDGIEQSQQLTIAYRIVRDSPDICNYPSREKMMRLQLEAEVARLRSDNAALSEDNAALTDQVGQLTLEIQELRVTRRRRGD